MEKSNFKKNNLIEENPSMIFKELQSSLNGLTSQEAKKRLKKYGANKLMEKKVNPVVKFLKNFWGPIPWMVEIAAFLSALIKHWEDFFIILTLLFINAIVGFWQEYKADNAIEMLKKKLAPKALALRNKKWKKIPAKELVPGDIIKLKIGSIVPADIKLIKGEYLQIDESALTGESLPAEKKAEEIARSGTIVKQGEMIGLVVFTGMDTFFGKTAHLVDKANNNNHFQKAITKIGNYLIISALILVALIFVFALLRHESMLDFFQFALVLIVAAIPAALPAVLSVTMAIGAIALAKKKAIVSKLSSIEEIAGIDILCSDKTGTITKNELTVADIFSLDEYTENEVLAYAVLASETEDHDAIDQAIIKKFSLKNDVKNFLKNYKILEYKPFNPVDKKTEASIKDKKGNKYKVSKGAPQAILSLVKNKSHVKKEIEKNIKIFAKKGYRALGIAKTDKKGEWHYIGLIPLFDPLRDDSAEIIKKAQEMGITVKMITGDHIAIAKETATSLGLGNNILEAESLKAPDKKALQLIKNADGFAQAFPEHKYRIIELLQKNGSIVGMTGDGVNDAPALKKADAGFAVDGSTDAAKAAASIVLTRPGLSVIVEAILQSRIIFQRMNNYSVYRITETVRILLFITLSVIVFNFYPITALMIVLLAILNDAPIMTIAFDNVKHSSKPDRWNMKSVLSLSTFLGIIGVIVSFGILLIGKEVLHLDNEILQSFIYLKLSVAGHLTIFITRTKGHFWSSKPALPLFAAIIITQIIATLITVYGFLLPAMGWGLAGFVWVYCLIAFLITDFLKVKIYRNLK